MKKKISAATPHELIRQYPITGLVEGWYFRQDEVSAGCYLVEGRDLYGRQISRQSHGDPDQLLRECVDYARQIAVVRS